MSDRVVTTLSIENLERLFSPPGLPLIDKGALAPTTSVAILGDAGAGKTTLATALAHSIAADLEGVVVYITTELAPTEVKYKLSSLGISASVVNWNERETAAAGDIVSQHLVLVDSETVSATIRKRTLEAAWKLVEGPVLGPPIRCVVVDAFPLPSSSGESGRDDVVTLIQALESRSISVILVQEAATEVATDYVPFVTDIVFRLAFDEDPDTKERIRKLACPKSRYARSLVGPHDTGVDHDRLGVWPDPMMVLAYSSRAIESIESPLPVFLPINTNHRQVLLTGGLLLSWLDEHWLLDVVERSPGVRAINVRCGPLTVIECDDILESVPDHEGAYSIAWAIRKVQQKTNANAVIIQDLESLLSRSRFGVPFEHVLESLRMSGLLVCVHGPRSELGRFGGLADLEATGRVRTTYPLLPPAHRSAASWLFGMQWPVAMHGNSLETSDLANAADIVRMALQSIEAGSSSEEASKTLEGFGNKSGTGAGRVARMQLHVLSFLIGTESIAVDALRNDPREQRIRRPYAWAGVAMRRDWQAARDLVDWMREGDPFAPRDAALWAGLCAAHAGNSWALDEALAALDNTPALLDLVIRGLHRQHRAAEIESVVRTVAKRISLSPMFVDWILADSLLETDDQLEEAAKRLGELANDKTPVIYRAQMLHNRGVALHRLGRTAEAQQCWLEAVALNSKLEVSREMLRSTS